MEKSPLTHLALIMDGNRRWAQQHRTTFLYDNGSKKAVQESISFCLERKIAYLSLYVFSLENLQNRDETTQKRLFSLLRQTCEQDDGQLAQEGVRVRFVGDRTLFPDELCDAIARLEETTKHGKRLTVHLLFCYGGQQELVAACKAIAQKVEQGELASSDVSRDVLAQHLWTGDIPHPDLLIRTGGAKRLSNFLLYQAAYSELMFVEYYWPEMNRERLAACIASYQGLTRNFGK